MHFSKVLLAAGLGQAMALSFGGYAESARALTARDLAYEDALDALYARDADAEAEADDDFDIYARDAEAEPLDMDDIAEIFARAILTRRGLGDKAFKATMNTVSGAKSVYDKSGAKNAGKTPQTGANSPFHGKTSGGGKSDKKPANLPKMPKMDPLPKQPSQILSQSKTFKPSNFVNTDAFH